MKITDFAEKQKQYTGANNKVKWVITNPEILKKYLEISNFKPSILKDSLGTSYATVKRFLVKAGLWSLVSLTNTNLNKGGHKRTTTYDKFGYKYADASHDYINDRGEIVRRFEHHVNAEIKYGRKLLTKEVVHHLDLDKSNNSFDNIVICADNSEHRKLHGQLEKVAAELVKLGYIKYDSIRGYYHELEELNESN